MTGAATAKPALRSLTSQSDVLQQGAASEAGRLSRPEFLTERDFVAEKRLSLR